MTIVQSLEKITDWLQTNVCDKIKLKAPHDEDVKIYEEVNPVAHTLFQPGKSKAPPQTKYQIPSVVVQLIDGADDMVKSNTRMKIQLSFMVWNPGKHPQEGTKEFTRNADGWKDVWNFVDHALQTIENAEYFDDALRVVKELGITFGQFQQDDALVDLYPYWGAWAILTVEKGLSRTAESYKKFL